MKLKKTEIWNYYEGIESHPQEDTHIKRWIDIILKTDGGSQRTSVTGNDLSSELDQILSEMKSADMLNQDHMSKKLYLFLQQNPQISLESYMTGKYPEEFISNVTSLVRWQENRAKYSQAPSNPMAKSVFIGQARAGTAV